MTITIDRDEKVLPVKSKSCPDKHVCYLSRQLADNAVFLHKTKHYWCKTIEVFPCGDHWHIGHRSSVSGVKCKQNSRTQRSRSDWARLIENETSKFQQKKKKKVRRYKKMLTYTVKL